MSTEIRRPIPRQIGKYRLTELLGAGGLGKVFRGEDEAGTPVAIKVLTQNNERSLARFQRELELGKSLNHPNLVRTLEGGEVEGHPYLVLELIPGEDLAHRLRRTGPIPAPELLGLARQLASGLDYLHDRTLIHRDLKPENLRLRDDGHLKILDLGLMHDPDTTAITATGTVLGTFLYMSPEQLRGGGKSPSMDLYAMAVLLYKLSTGRHPLYGEGSIKLSDYLPLPGLGEVLPWRPGTSMALDAFFRQGLDPDPTARFESAADLVASFESALTRDGLVERPGADATTEDTIPLPSGGGTVSSAALAPRPPSPNRPASGIWGAAAAVAFAALAGGAAWLLVPRSPPVLQVAASLALTPAHRVLVIDTHREATLHLAPEGAAVPRRGDGRRHYIPVAHDQDDLRLYAESGEPLLPRSLSETTWEPVPWNVDGSLTWDEERLSLEMPEGASPWKRALPSADALLQELSRGMLELDVPAWIFETQETGRRPGRLADLLVSRGLATLQANTARLLEARLREISTLPLEDIELWYLAHDLCLAEAYLHRSGVASPIDPLVRGLARRLIHVETYGIPRDQRPPDRPGRITFAVNEDFFKAEVPGGEERDAIESVWFAPQKIEALAPPAGALPVYFEAVISRATVFAHDYYGLVDIEGTRPIYFYEDPTGPGGQVQRELATQDAPQLRRYVRVAVPQALLHSDPMALQVRFRPWKWDGKHGVEHVILQAYGWTREAPD